MDDHTWAQGVQALQACFPQADMTAERNASRLVLYRLHLQDVDARAFLYACHAAIRHSRFFPTVSELRTWAQEWRPPAPALGPGEDDPTARRSPEKLERDRALATAGLRLIRETIERDLGPLPELGTWPAVRPEDIDPSKPGVVVADPSRLEQLRRQAAELRAAESEKA